MSKVITAEQAAALIKDGVTIGSSVMGLAGWPEELAIAIEKRFEQTGHPRDITLVHSSAAGDHAQKGATHLGHEGLVKRLICGNAAGAPSLVRLIQEDKIECYFIPQGVICQLWRAIAGNKPGVITKVGLRTFVDPRLEGGKITSITREDLVQLIEINGEEWLLYKKFPIDVAIIRGSVADENGNLTMDREMCILEALPLAMAAKNSGGIVLAQVEHIAKTGTLHPKAVRVPGALIDYVFTAKPENHMQTQQTYFNPAFAGDIKVPVESIPPLPLDAKKIIARRAAVELVPNSIINLGVGIPTTVSAIAAEEGVSDEMTLTTEIGLFGGIPASARWDFGAAYNYEASIDHASMFDFYDGGGLDVTFLGMAQADQEGNVNVTKFGRQVAGPGGFVNISQNSKKVVFCGNFTTGAETEVRDGKLVITKEGKGNKFVSQVDQVSFSGKYAAQINQPVVYVTERAVFTLEEGALTLIEIAPGVDLEKDVLGQMGFKPRISKNLKTMDSGIFQEKWGRLKDYIK